MLALAIIVGALILIMGTPRPPSPTAAAVENFDASVLDTIDQAELEALARIIASEVGSAKYTDDERAAIAWTARNRAAKKGATVRALVYPWGPQGDLLPSGSARPFSTRLEATRAHLAVAALVMAGQLPDATGGATAFFEPAAQDWAHGKFLQYQATKDPALARWRLYRSDAAGIRKRWTERGEVLSATIGHFEFYR